MNVPRVTHAVKWGVGTGLLFFVLAHVVMPTHVNPLGTALVTVGGLRKPLTTLSTAAAEAPAPAVRTARPMPPDTTAETLGRHSRPLPQVAGHRRPGPTGPMPGEVPGHFLASVLVAFLGGVTATATAYLRLPVSGRATEAEPLCHPNAGQQEEPPVPDAKQCYADFCAHLAGFGFTVAQPLCASWYNGMIQANNLPIQPLPMFGRPSCLAILVGNTKEVWPLFKAWLAEQVALHGSVQDPFDTYTHWSIAQAVQRVFSSIQTDTFMATDGAERLVSMQRLAAVSAAAHMDMATHLTVHPTFGAWVAWRAVVVVDSCPLAFGLPGLPPHPLPSPLPEDVRRLAAARFTAAIKALEAPGASALTIVRDAVTGLERPIWRMFLEVRDMVELGRREWRYCEEQLEYHYTKDLAVLGLRNISPEMCYSQT